MRGLQVECEALSDSLGESRGTVEWLRLGEMGMREKARYLETELTALKIIGDTELVTLKGKGEAELEALKRNEEAYVACLEKFCYEGLYQVST